MHKHKTKSIAVAVAMSGSFLAASTYCWAAEFVGSLNNLSASVKFDLDTANNKLLVTFSNTSSQEVLTEGDILSAVFFNSKVPISLDPQTAILGPGSSVLHPTSGNGTDPSIPGGVGGEWAARGGIPDGKLAGSYLTNQKYGISAQAINNTSGTNLFPANSSTLFDGINLSGNLYLSTYDYGLASPATTTTSGNLKVLKTPLINNSVVFTFGFNTGIPAGFNPTSDITDVVFQYGSTLYNTQIQGVLVIPPPSPDPAANALSNPEPVTAALSLISLMGIGIVSHRRRLN